jgi:hypothetical protein
LTPAIVCAIEVSTPAAVELASVTIVEVPVDEVIVTVEVFAESPKFVTAGVAQYIPVELDVSTWPAVPTDALAVSVPVTVGLDVVGLETLGLVILGEVRVLLVNVSVPANVARVLVTPGNVIVVVPATAGARTVEVPEVEPLNAAPVTPIVGNVKVLLVNVSVPANVARTPVIGSVTEVAAVVVKVNAKLPEVVKLFAVEMLPASVMVRPVLLTPVPPY